MKRNKKPMRPDMTKMNFFVSTAQYEWLRAESVRTGLGMSEMVRALLQEKMSKTERK